MKVLKFGGSSLANSQNISKVVDIVIKNENLNKIILVVSAIGGVTDKLISLANFSLANVNYKPEFERLKLQHQKVIQSLIKAPTKEIMDFFDSQFSELESVLNGIFMLKELSLRSLDRVSSFGEILFSYIIAQTFAFRGIKTESVDSRK